MQQNDLIQTYEPKWFDQHFERIVDIRNSGDISQAHAEMRKLANAGCGRAIMQMGRWCENGDGNTSRNYDAAIHWYKIAEDKFDTIDAHIGLGRIYLNQREYLDAFHHFRLLTEHSEEMGAFYAMGMLYHYGGGVEKDIDLAVSYYEKAVELGHALAAGQLAKIKQEKHFVSGTIARVKATWNAVRIMLKDKIDKRVGIF